MEVIKAVVDDLLEGVVRVDGAVAAEDLVKADLPEQLAEALDIVGLLQAVEGVQQQTKLVVAVLGQRVAALAGACSL